MNPLKLLLTITLLFISSSVLAHADLKTSLPKDGAMLMASPKVLQLVFTKDVRLVKLTLADKSGALIPLEFKPSTKASANYSLALPLLPSSNYQVTWTIMGKDAHKMKGKFAFMVHG
ncbi:copper resistance protein CopC [Colwellia psychrerythraea]|uniref:Copper resistance protein CopC n=1 Tax=Colwellia psychrerythraea TaxID=28229 RepID=A0A099KJ60_COLPS|nr:copper resistance CopC family protein [Colwellia psychrerythraea]KGJ90874.1 copper resistance protein CopC [Colwellia psychrerythraea]